MAKGSDVYMHTSVLFILNIDVEKVCVALLFYVHGKHLRSCRDGQLI